ncbi:Six-hairpin glycosidase [Artomyces pyxidatus]|uniref:Six-hairpin glycosidase n=1 Tax=Artomyces pyxidatus TaxID=48021 RepID=A0ACB8T1C1_9AGAM|nr:Six-hairpin glycosidase [Artomyces pyxidatus]
MRLSLLLPTLGLASQVVANSAVQDYFGQLMPVTKHALLHQTTGPEAGAAAGVVAAVIPDPEHPEFSVYWVRDACLVYDVWLNELTALGDTSLRPLMDDVTHALIQSQQVTSLAGNVFTGGLEEAVFYIDLSYILDDKARIGSPAADGPPFRAAILIKYADWLLTQNNGSWVAENLWPAINLDLQWISLHWNQSSWDLWWPPVWGGSYWTSSLQYRALRAGARLGRRIGRPENVVEYDSKASMVLDYMQTFWNPEKNFMSETTITDVKKGGRSGIGAAPLTVSIFNFDQSLGCDPLTFQPCSDKALASLKFITDEFRQLWPISRKWPKDQPALLGFFLEDQFIGGQPQFFSTFNAAEQLYDALSTWNKIGGLEVTKISLKFFQQFDTHVRVGRYTKGSTRYDRLTKAIRKYADDIILLLAKHTPEDFLLTESIQNTTGLPYGSRGMIRSLAAASSAYDTHNGLVPNSWSNGTLRVQTETEESAPYRYDQYYFGRE